MIHDLTPLCVTPNDIDEDVGEDGDKDERDNGCHKNYSIRLRVLHDDKF